MKCFGKMLLIVFCLLILTGNVSALENELYFIHSVAYEELSWNLGGYHLESNRKSGKIILSTGDLGADRFIKVIPHETQSEYVFFQPQHSNYVVDITDGVKTPGAQLQLWDWGKCNQGQMFKMIPVNGRVNTYYIRSYGSGLYLTAHGSNRVITQETFKETTEQQWYFLKADSTTMALPNIDYVYSIQNVMSGKFIDIPGSAPDQEQSGGKLSLWDMDNSPDRYMELYNAGDGYFYFHPLHSSEIWDVQGGDVSDGTDIQLWMQKDTAVQQFTFEYAGEPLTYYIKNRNSGKYVDASRSMVDENGAPIRIYPLNAPGERDNQKWRLYLYTKWQMPPEEQTFLIKSAYIDKCWEISDSDSETLEVRQRFEMRDDGDLKFKFISAQDSSWVHILPEQNENLCIDVPNGTKDTGTALILWTAQQSNNQKFAIQFTSPTTFTLRTRNWLAADITGGLSDDWMENGAEIQQRDPHYHKNQQFQLIYADGPKSGQIYHFPGVNLGPATPAIREGHVCYGKYQLLDQQLELIDQMKQDYSYTFFSDVDGTKILALFSSYKEGFHVEDVVEENGLVTVLVKEDSERCNSSLVIKLMTQNDNITVKSLDDKEFTFFEVPDNVWVSMAAKYAPQLRFHPSEISYPSPVEGILNNAYKVKPLPNDFTYLTTGQNPKLAINDQGVVLEIHNTSHVFRPEIHYRVGRAKANGTVEFTGHVNLTTGKNPSIDINNHSKVIQAHRHSSNDGIDIRYGDLNLSSEKVNFQYESDVTNGQNPSVTINDHNLFIMVNERGTQLEYHLGELINDDIVFYSKKVAIPYTGERPSIVLNNLNQIVLTYDYDDFVYYVTGQVTDNKSITFNQPHQLTAGICSGIDLNDAGEIVEVHQTSNLHLRENSGGSTGLRMLIHYRYGQLQFTDSQVADQIDFSSFVELTSGVIPDITVNNSGELVEIHETSSIDDNDIHYRYVKTDQLQKTVKAMSDLPPNESGYILVRKEGHSWEAASQAEMKIYVVISQVNNNIEYEYNFFYPTNGSNVTDLELLYHEGDWEKIYVTVNQTGNILECRYHHHADVDTFTSEQLEFVDGTHPVVYVARETHASYPKEDISLIETGDLVSGNGLHWNSIDNFAVVKAYGETVGDNDWIYWRGLWGSTLNSPSSRLWR